MAAEAESDGEAVCIVLEGKLTFAASRCGVSVPENR